MSARRPSKSPKRSVATKGGRQSGAFPGSVQEKLETAFGPDLFRTLVVITGVLCYPLMLYGIAVKQGSGH
jgi:hypothetical protein